MLRPIFALATVAMMATATPAAAQQAGTIAGRVVDPWGQPVPGAMIRIDGTTLGAASDMDGRYRLVVPAARIGQGRVTILVSAAGMAPSRRSVSLAPGTSATLNVQLAVGVVAEEIIIE